MGDHLRWGGKAGRGKIHAGRQRAGPVKGRHHMAAGFSEWKVNRQYSVNDRAAYLGKQYRCLVTHKSNSACNPKAAVTMWQKYTA
ncbi:carbohydrate-binding protein [Streptomyces sp. B21-083]|uniref:carbohydrate-binding protein n=1 Tax=Streptomyces sp. B21-083 TaxID=3039410 RepID=UPI003FA71122